MTITYPLAFPTATGVARLRGVYRSVVGVGESPFTFQKQTAEWDGQRIEYDITLPAMTRANAMAWEAFFLKLNGQAGTFLMGPPHETTNRGSFGGTPMVNGASQTGNTLAIDGASNGVTNWIRQGDWIQTGTGSTSRLRKQLDDANSDGSGNVSLTLWPAIRTALDDNAAIVTSAPKGIFRLASNEMGFDVDQAIHYGFTFGAVSDP